MKKNNIKIQLSAMNSALLEFAENKSKKEGLSQKETSAIKQRVLNAEPYINMEVYRSNKLYKTMANRSEALAREIDELKPTEEE